MRGRPALIATLAAATCSPAVDVRGRPTDEREPTADVPRWAICGRVLDDDGRPAKLAWVRFVPRGGGEFRQALTDFDGAFEAAWTTDMDYEMRVMFRDPKTFSEPGDRIGFVHGGARGLVVRLPRGR